MRLLKFQPVVCLLLLSVVSMSFASRKRQTLRPNLRPNIKQVQSTTLATVLRTLPTTSRYHRFRPNIHRRVTVAPAMVTLKQNSKEVVFCRQTHEIMMVRGDVFSYRICIPIGRTWVVYTYKCPSPAEFDPNISKCVTRPTTTTENSLIIQIASEVTHSTQNSNHSEVVTEASVSEDEDSSSSSEEAKTNIPQISTTTPSTSILFNNFYQNTKNISSKPNGSRDKFMAWTKIHSSVQPTSTTTNVDDNDNVVWEESPHYSSSPIPVTHWRQASSTVSPYKGRFPARVSLTPIN